MAFRRATGARRLGVAAAVGCMLMLNLLIASPPAFAAASGAGNGSSSKAAKDAARKAIPWRDLSPQDRRVAAYLVNKCSVFRQMPTRSALCDPDVFTFLARRPEVVANTWNLMGVSNLEVTRTGDDQYHVTDNLGTRGVVRVMHADWGPEARNRLVIYAEGVYEAKPMPRPLKARSLLVLHSAAGSDSLGRQAVTARLDSFIHFEQTTADLIARTLRPLITRTADHNFNETMKFVTTFSRTTEQNPSGVARLASRLERIEPEVRSELLQLCRTAADKRRQAGRTVSLTGATR